MVFAERIEAQLFWDDVQYPVSDRTKNLLPYLERSLGFDDDRHPNLPVM